MFISLDQVITSLERLHDVHPFFGYAYLGFKKRELPVATTTDFSYRYIKEDILDKYYKVAEQPGYFNPFKSTTRWVSERYESTSLQRIIADTFADAFMHEKGSSEWGWQEDYASILRRIMSDTKTAKIPLLDLAIWLYRNNDVPTNSLEYFISTFVSEFRIGDGEQRLLFDSLVPARLIEFAPKPFSDVDLLNKLGWPEGSREGLGVLLKGLNLTNVGPAQELEYKPAARVNLITGDNSLGKTFLLDCAWWAVTGTWMAYPADPSTNRQSPRSEIRYILSSSSGREEQFLAPYNRLKNEWQRPHQPFQGLCIYTNFSGAFAVWDPMRAEMGNVRNTELQPSIAFKRDEVWHGLTVRDLRGKESYVSNGLIRDWVTWQRAPEKYGPLFAAFEASLKELSPPEGQHLRPGRPVMLPDDSREIPTIRMPYGEVPVLYASAGVQRILSLAYMLVWAWFRHSELSSSPKREATTDMIVLIDEIESHLHPRWQRQIVPAIIRAIDRLQSGLAVQLHISTHSPLVLASLEPLFETQSDQIHHLSLEKNEVRLERLLNWKHGSVNFWLESEVFGLKEARSKPAEQVIEQATNVQLKKRPGIDEVESVNRRLLKLLPDDDPFWVRWRYFYQTLKQKK
jgi:hypothetical protein